MATPTITAADVPNGSLFTASSNLNLLSLALPKSAFFSLSVFVFYNKAHKYDYLNVLYVTIK